MKISSLLLIYFVFYGLALVLAYIQARKGTAPKARNAAAAMCIGAAGSGLIYVSALLEPAGTVPLVLVAALALCPVFVLGLGCLLGIGIATWRPQPMVQLTLGFLALGAPLLAILMSASSPAWSLAQDQNIDKPGASAFQSQTVSGRLGRYPIALPVSPQLATSYSCFADQGAQIGTCHADFSTATSLSDVPGGVPIFHEVSVARKASDCIAPCVSYARLAQWCQGRRDVTFSEWCHSAPGEKVTFSYDENPAPNDRAASGWRALPGPFGNTKVDCLHGATGITCKARFDIARNLQVTITMEDVDEAIIASRLEAAQEYVARLWNAMQPKR